MDSEKYPWYRVVLGTDLGQGDLLERCPVFLPPADLAEPWDEAAFAWEERDVVIMTQSCDLVPGREKVMEVLLCAAWSRGELTSGHLATPRGLEDARRGNLPGYQLLAESTLPGVERDVRIIDFRRVYSLPLAFARQVAARCGERLRLLPPYREHLSQAFARYFMRVGLPRISLPSVEHRGSSGHRRFQDVRCLMAELTLESLAKRVEALEIALASRESQPRRKDWRRVIGMFGDSEFIREGDEECLRMREAEREAARCGEVPD